MLSSLQILLSACFGVRQPYKVLCDGTFLHHLIVNNIAPADTAISNILGGSVKLFTTRDMLDLRKLMKENRLKLMLNSDGEIENMDEETHAERHARTVALAQVASS
ncbi:hypothetical protein OIU78_004713 [Salix suchowensis]|nr:hypothetical protein OIU78_004713 [Salix suchowensis]